MSLYPSLEDMKVDHILQQQQQLQLQNQGVIAAAPLTMSYSNAGVEGFSAVGYSADSSGLYPSLMEYMGLNITPEMIQQQNQLAIPNAGQVACRTTPAGQMQVAPVTGNSLGLMRADIKQGIRHVVLCKDQEGKIGLKVQSVNKGVFVSFVAKGSPASLAGLRFGDQILQINDETVAGWDSDKATKFFKKALPQKITLAVRDRPFERTITLQKDSIGTVGFVFKENKITSIVKDSSAARNGVLTEHHMVEVEGQNVVGLKEKEIKEIFEKCGRTVTITIIPSFIYDHIMKSIGWSLVKKKMDHSIPEL